VSQQTIWDWERRSSSSPLLHLKEQEELEQPTLLVLSDFSVGNWGAKVKKFGPTLKVLMHHGDKRPKGKAFTSALQRQVNPELCSDSQGHERTPKRFLARSVLDEAQNIKNPEAKQSQSVRQLQSSFRIALTGTPVEQASRTVVNFRFLNQGYLGSRQFFQRRFAMPIEKYGDAASLQTLRSLVQFFCGDHRPRNHSRLARKAGNDSILWP